MKMLDALQLLEKILLGESSSVELKSVQIAGTKIKGQVRGDLSDEIAAFANHKGGMIIFGVSDNREIQGIGSDSGEVLVHYISEICRDSIEPPIVNFSVESVVLLDEQGDEKVVVYIDILQSLWLHQSAGGFFLRQGDTKRKMTTEQIGRIQQARSQARIIRFDEQLVPNTDKTTLYRDLFMRFLRNPENEEHENNQLLKIGLLIGDKGSYKASVAGLLMCSDQPDRYLDNSFICAVCYTGIDKDANYQLDAKDFRGPLDKQIIDSFKFVEKHNKVSARKEVGRIDMPQYSMRAVFEALVNAVIHRDYSIHKSKIRLFMFADRLELYSPGALANTMTVDTLERNQVTRNELLSSRLLEIEINDDIAGQANRKHFLEKRGEGVPIILSESKKLSGKTPKYEMFGEELCLTIFAAKSLQDD